ncbi:MAG: hypothetical protein K2H99_03160, partial [Paramuribaculum sp.]|nr:hypothetical protein [Paramuribaculum sp.]
HLIRTIAIMVLAAVSAASPAYAQRHHGAARKEKPEHSRQRDNRRNDKTTRPGRNNRSRKENGSSYRRPTDPSHQPTTGQRPENDRRPGNTPSHQRPGNRPGNDKYHPAPNNGHRPDNRPGNGLRPGNSHRPSPGHNHRPAHGTGHRPSHGVAHRPPTLRPPHRPYRPVMRPYRRPLPPPHWHPAGRYPAIRTVLGISFGTSFNISLNHLYDNGYTVDGYGNDIVYLRNVTQLKYLWPDATLYYGPGGLTGSEFFYSTSVYDPSRYNYVYRDLVRTYGPPATMTYPNGGYMATWFPNGNGYIRLQFGSGTSYGGSSRFYTSLSFGD